ncbi:hypothetical protein EMIHUDRAFT_236755 [Emiliania huxleyi CCMP1516]|uniref:TerD domain-containing protein n=2 Tax=Emiliania huxleyi TaxID=2903 RepID=A0A0D3JRZ6_EMIH1|nr:hypothetical protein EMIHUDRAFT_236755 [Emiliania huxleyi CCMP1516]EOD26281.1 hypothetical protein EMIHUDRAFT_236755 [Emiliania huxleyi CCMP1516]|eukprot:XP_005778710.1 hypothetical protein EMIHUDRAFT_236755 [Emiliania huxleyi CCMP1516]
MHFSGHSYTKQLDDDVAPVAEGIPVVVALSPAEAVRLPVGAQAGRLERVYLGLGWRDAPGIASPVDLDCSVVGYEAGGSRDEGSTIWYGRLRNGEHRAMAGASSIVHTGDILTGQRGAGGLVDQERIYIWLPQLPDRIAALAVAADVYTAGISFYSLSEAYVRLVNADTEQELARLTLTSRHLGDAAEGRAMLEPSLFSSGVDYSACVPADDVLSGGAFDLLPGGTLPDASLADASLPDASLPDVGGAGDAVGSGFDSGFGADGLDSAGLEMGGGTWAAE